MIPLPDCFAASSAMRLRRTSFFSSAPLSFAIQRSLLKVTMWEAPHSTDFWMTESSLSPFGSAWNTVAENGGSVSLSRSDITLATTLSGENASRTQVYSFFCISQTVICSPAAIRSDLEIWYASSPKIVTAPSFIWSLVTKNRGISRDFGAMSIGQNCCVYKLFAQKNKPYLLQFSFFHREYVSNYITKSPICQLLFCKKSHPSSHYLQFIIIFALSKKTYQTNKTFWTMVKCTKDGSLRPL